MPARAGAKEVAEMKKRVWQVFLVGAFFFSFSIVCSAGMKSQSYRISSSVQSGGGAFMVSAHYQKESTLGQPTPLMNAGSPPSSKGYSLYPGFWYALGSDAKPVKALPWLMLLLD
jgi:hypothetical protein